MIYADPPWQKKTGYKKDAYENHYPTMPLEEIKGLSVHEISDANSVLYLWTTTIKLEESLEVLNAWGFKYKTNIVWDKQLTGLGFWFRNQHEQLLLGTKGGGLCPKKGTQFNSVISCKRGKHRV